MPVDRTAAYLWDMLDAAQTAVGFVEGLRFEDYMADRKCQMAMERAVEISTFNYGWDTLRSPLTRKETKWANSNTQTP